MSQSICLIKEETVSTDAATAMLKKGVARHCWAVWKNFTTLTGIERKLLIKKASLSQENERICAFVEES